MPLDRWVHSAAGGQRNLGPGEWKPRRISRRMQDAGVGGEPRWHSSGHRPKPTPQPRQQPVSVLDIAEYPSARPPHDSMVPHVFYRTVAASETIPNSE